MAAFIQKLFKSRKANPATAPRTPAKSEPSQPSQEETRQLLKKQQEQQLGSNPDQAQLATLAIDGLTATIRLEAAAALTDEIQLQQVQKRAKGRDKSVYQTVKQSLQSLKEQQAAETAVRQRIKTLIGQAEDQAASEDLKLYQARLEALQDNWSEVQSSATAEQSQQFLEAVHQCRERLKQMEQARQEEARHREQALQRSETLALLEQTLSDLTSQESSALPSLSALDALQKTQENRWLEATRDTQVEKQEQKDYESRMLALRNYLSAVRRFTQARDTLSELTQVAGTEEADDGHRQKALELLKEIEWPSDFPSQLSLRRFANWRANHGQHSRPAATGTSRKPLPRHCTTPFRSWNRPSRPSSSKNPSSCSSSPRTSSNNWTVASANSFRPGCNCSPASSGS